MSCCTSPKTYSSGYWYYGSYYSYTYNYAFDDLGDGSCSYCNDSQWTLNSERTWICKSGEESSGWWGLSTSVAAPVHHRLDQSTSFDTKDEATEFCDDKEGKVIEHAPELCNPFHARSHKGSLSLIRWCVGACLGGRMDGCVRNSGLRLLGKAERQ